MVWEFAFNSVHTFTKRAGCRNGSKVTAPKTAAPCVPSCRASRITLACEQPAAPDRIPRVRCPSLLDLPPPPPGSRGWPWTEECEPIADRTDDSRGWPRISIVTPSYNQGAFIEETIRSVLLQGYPDVEYIVIDGASTDESRSIIERYSPWLAYWVSEQDRGQSHAINKGLSRCTGDIVAYINSDDAYLKCAFSTIARVFRAEPTCNWLVGACYVIQDRDHPLWCDVPSFTDDLEAWYGRRCGLPQPSTFLRRDLIARNGLFEETLSYGFDHEYWTRLVIAGHRPVLLRSALAYFRLHVASKTSSGSSAFQDDAHKAEEIHEAGLPAETRARLRRSRSIRRWEAEFRDALELLAVGRWREGGRLLLSRLADRRLVKALLVRPDIVLRVFSATARGLPRYIRKGVTGVTNSRLARRTRFRDPLGEYDLWCDPPGLARLPDDGKRGADEPTRS